MIIGTCRKTKNFRRNGLGKLFSEFFDQDLLLVMYGLKEDYAESKKVLVLIQFGPKSGKIFQKQRKAEIRAWEEEKPKLREARSLLGNPEIEADDAEYNKILSDARAKYSLPDSPAMPVMVQGCVGSGGKTSAQRPHEEKISEKGKSSMCHYGLVHAPIPIKKAMNIPEAKKAANEEWDKLKETPAWD